MTIVTHSSHRAVVKSAGLIGAATMLSRVLGFIRDIIIAAFFGTGVSAQAFVVAFRIPNLLRDLVGEGATNAAFVPVLSEYLATGKKKEFWLLARTIFLGLAVTLTVMTIAGIALAPFIVKLIAPGFIADSSKFDLTVSLTRRMFPYILLIGLAAFSTGVLNSLKHFFTPSLGPALLNLCLIALVLLLSPRLAVPAMALAIGVLMGGFLHLGIQIGPLYRRGFVLTGPVDFREPGLRRMFALLLPRILGSCIYQLSVFIGTLLASLRDIVGEGGVAALYYSNRLVQLPLAIFAISLAQASLPTLSVHAAKNDIEAFRRTVLFSLKNVFVVTIPASVGLLVLARPIVQILFERGQFSMYSTQITVSALEYYTLGLFAYSGIKILVNGFYSLHDTATPVKVASISLVINILAAILLMRPLKIGGLALATSLAAIVNFFILLTLLSRRIGGMHLTELRRSTTRIVLASVIMGCVALASLAVMSRIISSSSILSGCLRLTVSITVSCVTYALFGLLLRIPELHRLREWIFKKQ
ncbi:MAG: murein biosynthesis integral membrane protein MurJ [Candidatus Omnitrophica bacterium]|nr:murein biosynthesis integral membrane protein MurJ [Candidatus Omnitrophota bacterium]